MHSIWKDCRSFTDFVIFMLANVSNWSALKNLTVSYTFWSVLFMEKYWFPSKPLPVQRCEICSKLTIKTLKQRQCRRYDVFIVNSDLISHLFLVFLLLTLKRLMFDDFRDSSPYVLKVLEISLFEEILQTRTS